MARFDGFIGGTYSEYSLAGACDRAINLVPHIIQSGTGPNRLNFYNRPGTRRFCTLPSSPVRALWGGNNRLFAVGGGTLYEVLFDGSGNFSSITATGAIANSANPAWIESNGIELAVYDGRDDGSIWIANGVTVTEALTHCRGLAYLDGYFVALRDITFAQGNQLNISALFDGTSWDELDFQTRTTRPDLVMRILADHEHLWLFGKKTTEVWVNEPQGVAFPFQRYPEGLMEQGIWSPWSLVQMDESMFWLGGDDRGVGVVWRSNGYTPQRVSNNAIENMIRSYGLPGTDQTDAVAYPYTENGHSFYVITFTRANKTLAYDAMTQMWHERGSWSGASLDPDTSISAYRAALHTMTGNRHFVAGGNNGNIYVADIDTYTDDGDAILFQRTAPHINNENKMIRHKRVELYSEQGIASSPTVTLETSNDGGRTYPSVLPDVMGAVGEYGRINRWQRMGAARDRVYRFSRTDANRQAWIDAFIEAEPGDGG